MQSGEQSTVKRCQCCGKEFIAWKPSLKVCSDSCEQNAVFDLNLSILNTLARIKARVATDRTNTVYHKPKIIQVPIDTDTNFTSKGESKRSIRLVCKASKAKAAHIPLMRAIKPPETSIEQTPEIEAQGKRVSLGIWHICRTLKAKVAQRTA